MLIELPTLIQKYKLDITGVLHVGAHLAEEAPFYAAAGVTNVAWVEASKPLCDALSHIVPRHKVINAVVGENAGEVVTFHVANNGQSSSILELGTHIQAHPEVHYVSSEPMTIQRLDDLYPVHHLEHLNFLNLDIQGAELSALKGLGDYLADFDYIYSEVNREHLYVDCCLVDEIDAFLSDFTRVETEWTNFGWGDAFYVRNDA